MKILSKISQMTGMEKVIMKWLEYFASQNASQRTFMKLCKMIVHSRQESKQEVKDVLGTLLNVAEENPDMAAEVLYRTCLQFFTDGYESATVISSILFHHLLFHPEIQEKIQEEIDAVFENKGDDGEIEQEDLNNMPYLDQVYHTINLLC